MALRPYQIVRPYLPYVQGLTLIVLAVVGIANFVSLREQLYQGVRRPIEERLEDRVRSWEEALLDRLRSAWRSAAEQADSPEELEQAIRADLAYVESIVLWDPIEPGPRGAPVRSSQPIRYPRGEAQGDRLYAMDHPCIAEVKPLQYAAEVDPVGLASAYLGSCAEASLPVRLEASIEAAAALERAGLLDQAAAALDSAGISPTIGLREALRQGIVADRIIVWHNRRAELLMARGFEQQAIDRYLQTGLEIARLPPPDAIGLDTWRWAIAEELRLHGRESTAHRLEYEFDVLDRRIRAYNEVRNQIAPEASAQLSREPRLVRDQYLDSSYLLYYGIADRADGTRVGVALQLFESRVISSFLTANEPDRQELVVVDTAGRWIMGKRAGAGELSVLVPLARTLPHLRVGVYDDYVQARMSGLRGQWLVPLIFTAIVLLIGIAALSMQISYGRTREELLVRQRELTTRVTHELKTPLAGIRVMAENLEQGVYRDETGREAMARRIVLEADRLTERIDELLRFSHQRTIPSPERVDIEDIIFELVDVWGPRMEQQEVVLEVDVDEAPPVLGDPTAIRDALSCLLDNALKYHRPEASPSRVLVEVGHDRDQAVVAVRDNGLGVPAAMRRKIFDRFVRVEGPNRGLAGGHGLGLAQVYEIVKAHKGSVECVEGLDGGAAFVVRLPGSPDLA